MKSIEEMGIHQGDALTCLGVAIWPIAALPPSVEGTEYVQCEPEGADLWGLYAKQADGTHIHLRDYETERDAFRAATELLAHRPASGFTIALLY